MLHHILSEPEAPSASWMYRYLVEPPDSQDMIPFRAKGARGVPRRGAPHRAMLKRCSDPRPPRTSNAQAVFREKPRSLQASGRPCANAVGQIRQNANMALAYKPEAFGQEG